MPLVIIINNNNNTRYIYFWLLLQKIIVKQNRALWTKWWPWCFLNNAFTLTCICSTFEIIADSLMFKKGEPPKLYTRVRLCQKRNDSSCYIVAKPHVVYMYIIIYLYRYYVTGITLRWHILICLPVKKMQTFRDSPPRSYQTVYRTIVLSPTSSVVSANILRKFGFGVFGRIAFQSVFNT